MHCVHLNNYFTSILSDFMIYSVIKYGTIIF